MNTTEKIKHLGVMYCSICGKEITNCEEYDFVQTRRKTTMFWHKKCYYQSHKGGAKDDCKRVN